MSQNPTDRRLKASIGILLALLILRNLHGPMAAWIWQAMPPAYEQVPDWYEHGYILVTYLLLCWAIWANSEGLVEWNADRALVWLVVLVGILDIVFYLPPIMGIFVLVHCVTTLQKLLRGELRFEAAAPQYGRIVSLVLITLAPTLVFVVIALLTHRFERLTVADLGSALFAAALPRIVAEEAMYRGISWMVLKRLGVRDVLAFSIQGLLFWLSHVNYWNQPVMFWFWLPWTAIWLGLIVWRSRSLATSSFTHWVLNLSAALLRM